MAWIRVIDETEAQGELQAAYERVRGRRGKVANIMKVHSLLPGTMLRHMDFYLKLLFAPGPLSRPQREMIATVVSAANRCDYCARHHGEALRAYLKDRALVEQIARDHGRAPLAARDRAMLDYALKLTRAPDEVGEADVAALRRAGHDDEAILLINLIASYFNFVNRVALGLGVSFDEDEVKGYRY